MNTLRAVVPALVGLLIATGVTPRAAGAQASIVPITHPVYDWLQQQRVEGRLPTYQHEVRPMSRATIVAHLDHLAAMQDRLSRADRLLLKDFRNEFVMSRLIANRGLTRDFARGLPGSIVSAIRERRDPVLFAGMSADSVLSGAVYGLEGGALLSLSNPDSSSYGTSKGLRVFLNTKFGIGWHYEQDNLWTAHNHLLIAQVDRYDTERFLPASTASMAFDSYFSYRAPRWFEAFFGWGGSVIGPAITDALVLRSDAPPLPAFRFQLGGPRLNLTYLHAALRSPNIEDTTGTPQYPIYNRTATPRWLVAHRLTWMPHERVSLSLTEHAIYANRGIEIAYLNPAAPFQYSQENIGDRDNLMFGGDAVVRPWNGTEISGAFVWDDRSAIDATRPTFGPFKKAALVGLEQRLLPGVRLGVGYTWVDPWTYTHWLRINTYESGGKPLGPSIGPNSEELAVRLTTWLPLRTRLMAGIRHAKRGLDPVGADTDISKCVGGNLFCGTVAKETPRFQGADVHVIDRYDIEAWTEPVRGFPLTLTVRDIRVRQGTQIQSARFVNFGFRAGY